MHTVYTYSGDDIGEFRRTYAEVVRQEYYDGELELDASDRFDVTVQKALAHPISLVSVVTRSGIAFRRGLGHIRANPIGVRVLWFVRRGSLTIVRSQNVCTAQAGQCVILNSSTPFYARASVEAGGVFDAVQAIVPAHLFLSHLPAATEFNAAFGIDAVDRHVITKLLDVLFGEGELLSRKAAEPLVAAFLETVADNISNLADSPIKRQGVSDKRLLDIEDYIFKNLTNPDLNYDEVARNCGISPRYLCYVLKANDTSFSQLLWSHRLEKAHEWLISPIMRDYPIHEIAFMAGFKSAAHFSRMFKARYGCPPKEHRELNAVGAEGASRESPTLAVAVGA
jgi:AraC-like DNA-binding protein